MECRVCCLDFELYIIRQCTPGDLIVERMCVCVCLCVSTLVRAKRKRGSAGLDDWFLVVNIWVDCLPLFPTVQPVAAFTGTDLPVLRWLIRGDNTELIPTGWARLFSPMNPQQSTGAKLEIATLKGAVPGRAPGPLSPTKSRTAQSRKAHQSTRPWFGQGVFFDDIPFDLNHSTSLPRLASPDLTSPALPSRKLRAIDIGLCCKSS